MNPYLTLIVIFAYFGLLSVVAYFTSRRADADAFYLAGRKAPWPLVAYGMLGVAISGITFISVPGEVSNTQFSYFQLVIGYAIGLLIVAFVLVPIYYSRQVISIYGYLEERFGYYTHKTGAGFFLLAHLLGAAFRLYLMAYVLQLIVFDAMGIPFAFTVLFTILLIWLYTFKGGIKTVIFTDVLQTTFLLLAVVISIGAIAGGMDWSVGELRRQVFQSDFSQLFFWSWESPKNFFKLVVTGIIITVMNNGLDQAVMQKHLSCATARDAQKNIISLSIILVFVNLLFLFLGGALVLYAGQKGIALPAQSDQLYPLLAVEHLGTVAGIAFVIGIAAAAYSSADTSLTGLTTAFCIDFLGYQRHRKDNPRVRRLVHLGFSLLLFLCIMLFWALNDQSVISAWIRASGYAYGPLLGLFAFGLLSKRQVRDRWAPVLCVAAPLISYVLDTYSEQWFNGYRFGYEIIVVNGLVTFGGLFLLQKGAKLRSWGN
jgi:Na+/proline symporter